MNVDPLPKLYSEDEARTYLGVGGKPLSKMTMKRLRKRKAIGFVMIANRPCYTRAHIEKFLEKNSQCPASESPTNTASSSEKAPTGGTSNGVKRERSSAAVRALQNLPPPE